MARAISNNQVSDPGPSWPSCFKNLLLQNQMVNLDKTWQECSLDEALQKLLKERNSIKNSGCHGNKMAENGKKSLKSSCDKCREHAYFV